MWTILVVVHVLVAVSLILIVLLQTGKGSAMGAAFGGSSQTLFGSRGPASFLGKLTSVSAILFMITSLILTILLSKPSVSTVTDTVGQSQPAADHADHSQMEEPQPAAVEEKAATKPVEEPATSSPSEPETIPQSSN